jgi:phosphatidylglycerol:prolipoprotein diacylglycerol transferase
MFVRTSPDVARVRRVLPELELGPLTLQTFGISFALAFLASGALAARRLKELGKPLDWAYEAVFAAMVGGLVGSRIDYLIQNYDKVSDDLLGGIFSGSGLVWFGGLVGGAVGVVLWARWRGFLEWRMVDAMTPGLAVGYAVGRVGCQLSGDGDYGEATDLPWGMAYPEGTVPTTEEVHPTPVFETVAMGLVALVLWNLRDRFRPGVLFAIYLVLAGSERLLIELIRRNDAVFAGLTPAQLFSVAMIAGGAALLMQLRGSPSQPRPA